MSVKKGHNTQVGFIKFIVNIRFQVISRYLGVALTKRECALVFCDDPPRPPDGHRQRHRRGQDQD